MQNRWIYLKIKLHVWRAAVIAHEKAVKEAGTVVAVPGTSEHQLGLTVDFVTPSYKKLDEGIRQYQRIPVGG